MPRVPAISHCSIVLVMAITCGVVFAPSTLCAQESAAEAPAKTPEPTTPSEAAQARLTAELDRLRDKHRVPALWAGKFYSDGRAILSATGVRKWKNDALAKPDDVIHIGSCTKAMTAVLIAQLCSEGKLTFEAKLSELFPDVEGLAGSAWGSVTVAELLQHRSGAPANAEWAKLDQDHPQDAVASRRAMLRWMVAQRRPEGPKFLYSNVGFSLLGHIAETIEKEPWELVIERRIFKPLGIETAGFGPVGVPEKQDEKAEPTTAWGHTSPPSLSNAISGLLGKPQTPDYQPVQIDNPPPLGPAGRVHMSLPDWSKFVLLFANEQGPQKIGVKPEIWSQMLTSHAADDYAGGWVLLDREWAGGRVLFHNGSNTTWYCVVFVPPGKDYCLLSATSTYSAAASAACDQAVAAANSLGF